METQKLNLSKSTIAFGIAVAVAAVVNGLLVIAKELSPAFLAWMKALTGHHWTTHCLIVSVVFVATGLILGRQNHGDGPMMTPKQLIFTIVGGVCIGLLAIAGFYAIAG